MQTSFSRSLDMKGLELEEVVGSIGVLSWERLETSLNERKEPVEKESG